ncbi:MAG: hypothetical protein MZV64_10805 [Ignavibacteriales bacterium]|nr:hypothetical protein [Ignavibacteriales bacterium]
MRTACMSRARSGSAAERIRPRTLAFHRKSHRTATARRRRPGRRGCRPGWRRGGRSCACARASSRSRSAWKPQPKKGDSPISVEPLLPGRRRGRSGTRASSRAPLARQVTPEVQMA